MTRLLNYRLGDIWIHVDHENQVTTTHFPDGARASATPHWSPEEQARVERLGYVDCWHRCWTHELVHSWLAARRGMPFSPAIRAVADGIAREHASEIAREEAAVEAVEQIRHLIRDLMGFIVSGVRAVAA